MEVKRAKVIGILRHRLGIDGDGVTTLVAFHGCPLRCRFCLNPQSLGDDDRFPSYSPLELYNIVNVDNLYFLASGGGITFGGGEPAERVDFIEDFRELCGLSWQLNLETSLNVPSSNVERLLTVTDTLIIDIKDINPDIYRRYTGVSNDRVLENLHLIAESGRQNDCIIRIPYIPGFNTDDDRLVTRKSLEALGFNRFDLFTYQIRRQRP